MGFKQAGWAPGPGEPPAGPIDVPAALRTLLIESVGVPGGARRRCSTSPSGRGERAQFLVGTASTLVHDPEAEVMVSLPAA